jgi:hypothetical protein
LRRLYDLYSSGLTVETLLKASIEYAYISNDLLIVEQMLDAVHLHYGGYQNDYKFEGRQLEHFLIVSFLLLQKTPLPLVHPGLTFHALLVLVKNSLQFLRG